jgi:hypothetical protein
MKKPTSKIHRPTGKWRSFQKPYADLKYDGIVIGSVFYDKAKDKFRCRIKIVSEADEHGWKNAVLAYGGADEIVEAIQWFKDNYANISAKSNIYFGPSDK